MKKTTLLFAFLFPAFLFADSLDSSPVRRMISWEVRAAYLQPTGNIATPVDLSLDAISTGNYQYFPSFSGRTGLNAKTGINLGLTRFSWRVKSADSKMNFGMVFSPINFNLIIYDLKSINGPQEKETHNRFLYEYECAVGPAFHFPVNENCGFTIYSRFGISLLHTKGAIEYVRSNFEHPNNTPYYTGNDLYYASADYTYNGLGMLAVPGLRYENGNWNAGIEYHLETGLGKYEGTNTINDYYGEFRKNENSGTTSQFANTFALVYLSRSL